MKMLHLQLMPLTTERATSLAASSYTCFVLHSPRKTLSITGSKKKTVENNNTLETKKFQFVHKQILTASSNVDQALDKSNVQTWKNGNLRQN